MPVQQQASPPPAPPSTLPFLDDFTRTDNMYLGTNYIVGYGSFTTNGTKAVAGPDVGSGSFARYVGSLPTTNYSVTGVMNIPTTTSYWSGVMARSPLPDSVSSDFYSAEIRTSSGGQIGLWRRNAWVWTQLGTTISTPIAAGTNQTVKLVATGTNPVHLEVWLNGVQMISYDDSSVSRITTGQPGMFSYVPAGGVQYDSFRIDAM
jgi:hypothetical protein